MLASDMKFGFFKSFEIFFTNTSDTTDSTILKNAVRSLIIIPVTNGQLITKTFQQFSSTSIKYLCTLPDLGLMKTTGH